ncbi:MAG: hypothetical protein AABP62_30890 [Planctomycetota bacterium]
MSDTNPLDTTAALGPETKSATSSAGSRWYRSGPLLRAVFYTPMVLAAGALSAAVVFPELSEYASPLLDVSQHGCPFSSVACSAGPVEAPCCAHSQSCPSSGSTESCVTDANLDLASTTEDEVPADALAALEANVSETTSN